MKAIDVIRKLQTDLGQKPDGIFGPKCDQALANLRATGPDEEWPPAPVAVTYPRAIESFSSEGFKTTAYELSKDGPCSVMADADVDVDGSGSSHGDPDYQPDTTLHLNGKPLNADVDKFIVLPGPCIHGVHGTVMGCQATVHYRGESSQAVVGDQGPTRKIGELSRALAIALGIPPSPINGGVDDASVRYEWQPGVAAVVDGKAYDLQP